jgi:hypothetical protein
MTIDEFSWEPRAGSTGDDRFNVPGAKGLSGTVVSGEQIRIDAVPASYSTPPTLGQVSAGSGVNQVLAEYNRQRQELVSAGFSASVSGLPESYVSGKVQSTRFRVNYPSVINQVRTVYGFGSYTFNYTPANSSTALIDGAIIAEMRKALTPEGPFSPLRYGTLRSANNNITSTWVNASTTEAIVPERLPDVV